MDGLRGGDGDRERGGVCAVDGVQPRAAGESAAQLVRGDYCDVVGGSLRVFAFAAAFCSVGGLRGRWWSCDGIGLCALSGFFFRRYRQKFRESYPKERKALVPYVW